MFQSHFYPFHPEKIFGRGLAIIGGGLAIALALLFFWVNQPFLFQIYGVQKSQCKGNENAPLSFVFEEKPFSFPFSLPRIEAEIALSFAPQRPDRKKGEPEINVCLKRSGQCKRVSLPCRMFLQFFEEEALGFADWQSPFWLELARNLDGKIQAVVGIETPAQEKIEVGRFWATPRASAVREEKNFPEGSAFRMLAEARWLGHNVLLEKETSSQIFRVAIGAPLHSQSFDLSKENWLIWGQTGWNKGELGEEHAVVARIASTETDTLILEGWDEEKYVQIPLTRMQPISLKTKGDEIFKSIRIRSDKQISCMMEKQCLILRCGDWVLKSSGRWKVLRKKEERDAYKAGKIEGELFVFEQIVAKQEQKFISGFLFNAEKTQALSVDLPAYHRLTRKTLRKTKG